ncbi:MAG: nitroreductase family protein [Ignavibacteriales bacterium]|nr:nitroreductase family protein [Ignavibacteriales bacterium]
MDAIIRRRSIRSYTNQPISDEIIYKLLNAAMCAPSAGNERPWHFIVVRDKKQLVKLSQTHRNASMISDAQAAIVVCADLELEIKQGMWVQDCSAATENILIEATDLGLGAVWVGVYPREDRVKYITDFFSLPKHIIPLCIISLGYPAEQVEQTERFDKSRIHIEQW